VDSSLPISGFTESILCHLHFIGSLELQVQVENSLDGTRDDTALWQILSYTSPSYLLNSLITQILYIIFSPWWSEVQSVLWHSHWYKHNQKVFFFFLIGVQFIHNTMLVSATQQSESAIHTLIHTYIHTYIHSYTYIHTYPLLPKSNLNHVYLSLPQMLVVNYCRQKALNSLATTCPVFENFNLGLFSQSF